MSAPALKAATLLLALVCAGARAQTEAPSAGVALGNELREGFYSRINVLAFGVYSDLNDNQRFFNYLGFSRSQAEIDFRPDFSLTFRRFDFGLKPRLLYARNRIDARFGETEGRTENRHQGYINEAYMRFRASDNLTAIVSRENLQWGPAALLSASNPFNPNNGKGNPNVELPGLDYVRLVAVPSPAWTVSLISNHSAGRLGKDDQLWPSVWTVFPGIPSLVPRVGIDYSVLLREPFQKTHAVKVDYTGDGYYGSLIASHRQRGANRLGFFGGWNASEALLLYAEGSVEREQAEQRGQGDPKRLLAGGAYTLESGQTLSAEYFHNSSGCTIEPVLVCAAPPRTSPRLPLFRRRYALLQYVDTKLLGSVNLVLRVIRNIDDRSTLSTVNVEWEVGQHVQLYLVPTLASGHDGAEFPNLPKRSVFFGLSYTF